MYFVVEKLAMALAFSGDVAWSVGPLREHKVRRVAVM